MSHWQVNYYSHRDTRYLSIDEINVYSVQDILLSMTTSMVDHYWKAGETMQVSIIIMYRYDVYR